MSRYGQYHFQTLPGDQMPNTGATWGVCDRTTGTWVWQRIPQKAAEGIAAQMNGRPDHPGQIPEFVARNMEDRPMSRDTITTRNSLGWELRDWFAGQALAGLLAARPAEGRQRDRPSLFAADAYQLADALLAARTPPTTQPDPVLVLDVEVRRHLEVVAEKLDQLQDEGPDGGGWKSDELNAVIVWLQGVRDRLHRELDARSPQPQPLAGEAIEGRYPGQMDEMRARTVYAELPIETLRLMEQAVESDLRAAVTVYGRRWCEGRLGIIRDAIKGRGDTAEGGDL